MQYVKKKEIFVGIDSDGTAFDTMTVKHTHAFIPCMIRVWHMQSYADAVYRTAEYVNLYSRHRGINRFPGLVLTFDLLRDKLGAAFQVGDYEALRQYCSAGVPLSNDGLAAYMQAHPDAFLEQVMRWSREADALFAKKAHGLPPFAHMAQTVASMKPYADLMVVSAASAKGLREDWGHAGLLEQMDYVAGQEAGSKTQQLALAMQAGYAPERCLMIGDGDGDYRAAKENGMCFYPIVPAREAESWRLLGEKYFELFRAGTYQGAVEERLYDSFLNVLSEGERK